MPAIVTIRPIPEALAVIQAVQLLGARYEQARADNTMFVYEDDTLPPREGTTPHAYARSLDGFLLHAQRYVIASNYIPLAVALEGAHIEVDGQLQHLQPDACDHCHGFLVNRIARDHSIYCSVKCADDAKTTEEASAPTPA